MSTEFASMKHDKVRSRSLSCCVAGLCAQTWYSVQASIAQLQMVQEEAKQHR